jgi:hypothetical protein
MMSSESVFQLVYNWLSPHCMHACAGLSGLLRSDAGAVRQQNLATQLHRNPQHQGQSGLPRHGGDGHQLHCGKEARALGRNEAGRSAEWRHLYCEDVGHNREPRPLRYCIGQTTHSHTLVCLFKKAPFDVSYDPPPSIWPRQAQDKQEEVEG